MKPNRENFLQQLEWLQEKVDQQEDQIKALEHKIKMLFGRRVITDDSLDELPYGRYFMLKWEEEECCMYLWFGDESGKADDGPPRKIYEEIDKILRPLLKTRLSEAQEGCFQIDCTDKEHGQLYWKVRKQMEDNGWTATSYP